MPAFLILDESLYAATVHDPPWRRIYFNRHTREGSDEDLFWSVYQKRVIMRYCKDLPHPISKRKIILDDDQESREGIHGKQKTQFH